MVGAVPGGSHSPTGFGFQERPGGELTPGTSAGSPTCCASSVNRSTCAAHVGGFRA